MQQYLRNRHQFPHDQLEMYAGQYVAWSPDGTRIVASDEDPLQLVVAVEKLGFDLAEVVIEPVPHPDEIVLGGICDFCRTNTNVCVEQLLHSNTASRT